MAIKDIRNLFRLKIENKLINDRILRDIKNLFEHGDIRNIFRFKKNYKVIKNRIFRHIRNLFDHEEENYYKPVKASNFWNSNYIDMKVKVTEIKYRQLKKYLNKIGPCKIS